MGRDADFEEFYRAQWPRLVAALAHAIPDGDDPRDAAQEAFARAYSRWPSVRNHEHPDAWLFLTAFRLATRIRQKGVLTHDLSPPSPIAPESADLVMALRTLPERQRAALLLRGVYGLSTRETALALHCREGTVKSLLARGRGALAASLEVEDPTHG